MSGTGPCGLSMTTPALSCSHIHKGSPLTGAAPSRADTALPRMAYGGPKRNHTTKENTVEQNSTIAQTVAYKFTQMDADGKAYLLGYILGKESERQQQDVTIQEKQP